jgi:predicted nucleotide-binding protein (sugar kinase/HSP70/actin superfamily)
MLRDAMAVLCYGDVIMTLKNQVAPYEIVKGETERIVGKWADRLESLFKSDKGYSKSELSENIAGIINDFSKIKTDKSVKKIKVGIVGEIYAKFSKLANNNLEQLLFEQGCEVMVPGLMPFLMFKVDNRQEDINLYGGSQLKKSVVKILMKYLGGLEDIIDSAFEGYSQFVKPSKYSHVKSLVDGIIGYGNKMGEGWMLVAEMMELIENGYENIVCCQPFGCLPNHIVAKGMVRKIKQIKPQANIVPIDYDPGATRVNQENRIKLMLASARY